MTIQAAGPAAVEPAADGAQAPTAPQLRSSTITKRKRSEDTPAAAAAVPATADVGVAAARRRHEVESLATGRQADAQDVGEPPVPSAAAVAAARQQQPPEAEGSEGSDEAEGSQQEEEEDADEAGEESGGGEEQEPRSHQYGVRPWGNFYMSQQPEIRTAGMLGLVVDPIHVWLLARHWQSTE